MNQVSGKFGDGDKRSASERMGNRSTVGKKQRESALESRSAARTKSQKRVAASSELFDLELPARAEYLEKARQAVARVADQLCLKTEDRYDLLLAVGEACNNAVLHGSGSVKAPLQVRCRLDRVGKSRKIRALQIEVANPGNGFLPPKRGAIFSMPEAEDLAAHGRGLPLMRQLMDDVQIVCENGNTVVRLTKRIPA